MVCSLRAHHDNTIGGTAAGAGNVVSGNTSNGIHISRSGTTGNLVAGNWIGTNATGTAALGNAGDGVKSIRRRPTRSAGPATGAGNLISGNTNGVEMSDASANLVQGNLIGLDQTGHSLGNRRRSAGSTRVPRPTRSAGPSAGRATSSPANAEGVMVTGAATTGTLIAGNFIGTDIEGAVAVGNLRPASTLAGGHGDHHRRHDRPGPQRDLRERRRRHRRRKRCRPTR